MTLNVAKPILAMLSLAIACMGQAQVTEILVDKALNLAVDEIAKVSLSDSALNDPGGPVDTTMDWTAIWRSSEGYGERRSQYGPDDWEARPKGQRKGCICMDGMEEKHKGRGACAGRGGVRYWIYETPEGKELHHPTARHYRHPEPMTKAEKMGLAAYNEEEEKPGSHPFGSGHVMDSFVNLAIILASSTMVIYYLRLLMAPKRKARRRKTARPSPPAAAAGETDLPA